MVVWYKTSTAECLYVSAFIVHANELDSHYPLPVKHRISTQNQLLRPSSMHADEMSNARYTSVSVHNSLLPSGLIFLTSLDFKGYNDQGEMLPMQGGTNSKIYAKMCDTLVKEGKDKRKFLKACWYTAKDREQPIDAAAKERNCHG